MCSVAVVSADDAGRPTEGLFRTPESLRRSERFRLPRTDLDRGVLLGIHLPIMAADSQQDCACSRRGGLISGSRVTRREDTATVRF